jgi:PST family polysaccharide transporter
VSSEAHKKHSYGQILKSSSIIGGAQGINYLIGMVRVKVVAVLLGPSGVGLVGLYVSATGLVSTVAGLGISSSGVREVAEAHGSGKAEHVARTVKTLRRVCWVTGILGWLLCAAFSYPLSLWTFGSGEHAWAVAILGATILIASVSGGQSALIQGTRRIGDLARMGVLGAITGTIAAIGLYGWLGQKGIVPVLLVTAAVSLGFSWWFARKTPVAPVALTWRETLGNSKRLVHIGVAFMYGDILGSLVGLMIRSLIVKKCGLDANGLYSAAWGISGMFAGFIITAMGTDFYPRLTAVAQDNEHVNRLVNEQTEIGILLALPGLLGTLAFAPWMMHIFYSAKFLPGAALLPWFVIGVFGQVITFPLGMIQMAKGATKWMYFGRTEGNVVWLGLTMLLIKNHGLAGVAWAFALFTYIHCVVVFGIALRLSKFAWTTAVGRLVLSAVGMIGAAFVAQKLTNGLFKLALGALITGAACLVSLRGISLRLGENHRIVKMALKFPGARLVCGL